MKPEEYQMTFDQYDRSIFINALNTLRSQQIQANRPTAPVDELIGKVAYARKKKHRALSGRRYEER